MRLIDAEAFEESIEQIEWYHLAGNGEMVQGATSGNGWYKEQDIYNAIEEAPTIEAKPVVYCKDCKYNVANSKHEPLDITDYTDIVCEYFMTDGMSPDDYCSQGVKIPVIGMEDVPKIMEELPSVEENPILKAVKEMEK